MSDITIQQFCDIHRACKNGRKWALTNCVSMQDAWNTIKPEWLVWIATRPGVLADRELRLFAVWSARQVQHLMKDPRSAQAIDTAERFATGKATKEELSAAWDAAWDDAAAWAAAWAAAAATWAAAAAWVTGATAGATRDARDAARDAARHAQAEWLRKNTAPNFKEDKP